MGQLKKASMLHGEPSAFSLEGSFLLTKEYKLSEVLLQKFEYGQVDLLTATKESLSTERALSLQRPDVDLFLAISKCAMA